MEYWNLGELFAWVCFRDLARVAQIRSIESDGALWVAAIEGREVGRVTFARAEVEILENLRSGKLPCTGAYTDDHGFKRGRIDINYRNALSFQYHKMAAIDTASFESWTNLHFPKRRAIELWPTSIVMAAPSIIAVPLPTATAVPITQDASSPDQRGDSMPRMGSMPQPPSGSQRHEPAKRGPKVVKRKNAELLMIASVDNGIITLDQLCDASEESLRADYGGYNRETMRKARTEAVTQIRNQAS